MTASLARTIRAAKALDRLTTEWSTYMLARNEIIVSRDGGSLFVATVEVTVELSYPVPVAAMAMGVPHGTVLRRHGIGTRVASSKEELAWATVEAERDAFCEAAIRHGVDPAVLEEAKEPSAEPVAQASPMSATMRVTRTRKQKEAIANAATND